MVRIRMMCLALSALSLCACAGTPSPVETAHSAHVSRYSEELAAAAREHKEGRLSDAEFAARVRAAAGTLATADLATPEESDSAQASGQSAPAPESGNSNGCFLISCPVSQPVPARNEQKPAAQPQLPSAAAQPDDAAKPSPPKPDAHSGCLLIECG